MDYNTYNKKFLGKFKKDKGLAYKRARQIPNRENTSICPDCGAKTISDIDMGEIYCTQCGLIVKGSISYVGVKKVKYPYGTLIYTG